MLRYDIDYRNNRSMAITYNHLAKGTYFRAYPYLSLLSNITMFRYDLDYRNNRSTIITYNHLAKGTYF
jgi:hypothetical protein